MDDLVPPSPLHGRRRELATLDGILRAVAVERRGGVILIQGERGSGRTRLLDAAQRQARRDGTPVLHAGAIAAARGRALKPLLDALGAEGDPTAADIERRLTRAAARGPLVVAIDDLDAADDATLQALRELPRRLAGLPVVWLFTLAPGRADMTARALSLAGAITLRVPPLDPGAVRALARDVLGAIPGEAVIALLDDLAGFPAPIVELLDALGEERLIELVDGTAHLTGRGLRHVLCELGVRHPAPDDDRLPAWAVLTPSELSVVEVVASGATNREAAERLFLSPHTVSSHLRHAFEKLGICSRVELAILFAGEHRTVARCRPTTALAG